MVAFAVFYLPPAVLFKDLEWLEYSIGSEIESPQQGAPPAGHDGPLLPAAVQPTPE